MLIELLFLLLQVKLTYGRLSTKFPPLGFNTWNHYKCDINETLIRESADLLVSTGLKDAGYIYVNVDDCWAEKERDANGYLCANRLKFPSGMKALGDYIHKKGLKFGIYGDRGSKTCQGYPGSATHEVKDAITFASWGVDYFKYDNCFTNPLFNTAQQDYTVMRDALEATGRDIYFSICTWGQDDPWIWGPKVGDSWRISGDIADIWKLPELYEPNGLQQRYNCPCPSLWCPKTVISGGHDCSVLNILHKISQLTQYTSKYGFNDADMLEVGRSGLNYDESKSHFALWAALKSPLLLGADLSSLDARTLALLKHKELLAINQDSLKISASLLKKVESKSQVWGGPLADGSSVLLVMNEMNDPQTITLDFADLGFAAYSELDGKVSVKDLFSGREMKLPREYNKVLRAHDTWVLKVFPRSN